MKNKIDQKTKQKQKKHTWMVAIEIQWLMWSEK